MPEYNAIQTSRLDNWVRRLLGVRNGGIMPTVAPELGAAVNLPTYFDVDLLAGYRPWGTGHTIPAGGAGTYAMVDIANLSSGWLVILKANLSSGANAQFLWELGPGAAGALLNASYATWRDTRLPTASFPLNATGLQISESTPAAAPPGANFVIGAVQGLARTWIEGQWVCLGPGGHFVAAVATANIELTYQVDGYLRAVDPDELATG